jgi:hypothetical protein
MEAKAPLARCGDCPLESRQFVPGYGPPRTDRVIVGESPGETEAVQGEPFVGRSGGRLNQALAVAGVDRSAAYITNTVLCHPEGTESPPPLAAIAACHPRFFGEIELRMPRKVLALVGARRQGSDRRLEAYRAAADAPPGPSPFQRGDAEVRGYVPPPGLPRNQAWPERIEEDVRWLGESSDTLDRKPSRTPVGKSD